MKLVIVGGVAGGASAAARARRLSEDAEIVVIERGPDVSFLNEWHALLVRHGQQTCTKSRPRCEGCPLLRRCQFGRSESARG